MLRVALLDVYAEIRKESVSLDQAFSIRPDVFPEAFRHIIRVGTTKGDPSDMLTKYGQRQLLTAENMAKVKGALIYPSVVLSLAAIITLLLTYFILPRMGDMYQALLDPKIWLLTSLANTSFTFLQQLPCEPVWRPVVGRRHIGDCRAHPMVAH